MENHYTPATRNPYIQNSPAPPPVTAANTITSIGNKFESAAKKSGSFAEDLYTHFRTGPGLVNVAMARLGQATRLIFDGGFEHTLRQEFGHIPGEKLKNAHPCYLSITGGPIMGTLYVSNKRVAFRSDSPVWNGPGSGPGQWVYYKVVIMVDQIKTVNSVANRTKSTEKYIEILTTDGHEFWFMGFICYDWALDNLHEALSQCSAKNICVH